MTFRNSLIILSTLIFAGSISAQYNFTAVLPGLEGQTLLFELENDFRPSSVLPYDLARDTMFRNVYGVNDSLSCVYTSYRLPMPPGQDPTQVVYLGGAANGINTEHSWPRSYGAENGNPKSDMHHLFPTRLDVNSDRGTLPFLEVPDNQANNWYYLNSNLSNIPNTNIDLYAERSGSAFEPPEQMKGNIARAIMYFKAIYPNQANQAPNDFFSSMQGTLCEWHSQDPVDSLEWHRTFAIAKYQSNKPNPFVLDCTLPQRAFCPQAQVNCNPGVSIVNTFSSIDFALFPNPSSGIINIQLTETLDNPLQIRISNSLGQTVFFQMQSDIQNNKNLNLVLDLRPGIYWLEMISGKNKSARRIIIQ